MNTPVKRTILSFVIREQRDLLMIYKKRGMGEGKLNMPGGKVEPGESLLDAVVRETQEETGIVPLNAKQVALLEFSFPKTNLKSWNNQCAVFVSHQFSGDLIADTDETRAFWAPLTNIPYDQMWESDKRWVPWLLEGKTFHIQYQFNDQDQMIEEDVKTWNPSF